ncbi:MAG: family 1 glycosylhydrolase [Anaerolineae bacterium]|nr:family 1 glycosylhydrolase [Anaerolineae bacterium]
MMISPFYWGIGIENCWMAEHNEKNRPPKRLLDVYLQMQHYITWREDLDRVADLGVKVLRYSVPWYKANPKPGVYDWCWIAQPLEYMVQRLGIIPVVDLIHYGTPLWMENSVLNHAFPQRIAEYAAAFARQFKGLVNHYTPHNEPQISAFFGGYQAYWPPYLVGIDGWIKVGLNIATGMVLTSQALRAEVADAVLISAECLASPPPAEVREKLNLVVPEGASDDFTYQVQTFPSCLVCGKVKLESPFRKALARAGATEEQLVWFMVNEQSPDIVGHNFYPNCFDQEGVTAEEAIAKGARDLGARLRRTATFFQRPVYLSETSTGYTDEQKAAWMRAAYGVIAGLRAEGLPIVGMNWWPLFETIQWDYRDTARTVAESIRRGGWNNGLYLIEERFDGTLARVRTGAADAYRALITAHPSG